MLLPELVLRCGRLHRGGSDVGPRGVDGLPPTRSRESSTDLVQLADQLGYRQTTVAFRPDGVQNVPVDGIAVVLRRGIILEGLPA